MPNILIKEGQRLAVCVVMYLMCKQVACSSNNVLVRNQENNSGVKTSLHSFVSLYFNTIVSCFPRNIFWSFNILNKVGVGGVERVCMCVCV